MLLYKIFVVVLIEERFGGIKIVGGIVCLLLFVFLIGFTFENCKL